MLGQERRVHLGLGIKTANFPLGFAPENGPHQVSNFLRETQEKAIFRGTWWGPFSGAKQSGKLPLKTQMNTPFLGHVGAMFGLCGTVGPMLVLCCYGGSYVHFLFGLYFANLGFKKNWT